MYPTADTQSTDQTLTTDRAETKHAILSVNFSQDSTNTSEKDFFANPENSRNQVTVIRQSNCLVDMTLV